MSDSPSVHNVDIVIVGTGFAGLGMAIRLLHSGRKDFVVLERASDVGGTWRDNRYPGCACDIPSRLYSYSFEPQPRWSQRYPSQREIADYLRACARRNGLYAHIRFGRTVRRASFDDGSETWTTTTGDDERFVSRLLILGTGGLRTPIRPSLRDADDFRGTVVHTAMWPQTLDLRGQRVAVIGTGASAVQLVPEIAPQVAHLDLYQRSAAWVLPKPTAPIAPGKFARQITYWTHEARAFGFVVAPRLLRFIERSALDHLRREIDEPQLRAALTPTYRLGCKRILLSNDYYSAVARPNVALVTSPIARMTATGIETTDGRTRDVDTVIFATGFNAQAGPGFAIAGRRGRRLSEAWRERASAYLGMTVADFPNLFFLVGPNTGLGHNSMVVMIEAQITHVLAALRALDRRRAHAIEVRPEAQHRFQARLRARLQRTVWASGCRSWYLDARGQNTTLWPDFSFRYRARTRRIRPADYRFGTPVRRLP